MKYRYFIRTTNERILDKTYAQIDYELLIDLEHKPVKSLIEQLKYINQYDSILLEDDLILCKDFKNIIESVISQYPNEIITFFSNPKKYIDIHKDNNFSYSQCRYYPKGSMLNVVNKLEKYVDKCTTASFITRIAKEINLQLLHYRPCLVQHLENGSLLGIRRKDRRTAYFIDYLDDLGISYEEANTKENNIKLIELMKSKFKEIDNK